jgi:aspartyl-tRNA(Asn)/glutamyl-tRNA(Gln) amidotransferase subunit A
LQAQKVRKLIYEDFKRAYQQVDVILTPTATDVAFKFGAKTDDPVAMYMNDIYTIAANLAGIPAMSLPAGFVNGLPVGFQLMGDFFSEAKLLNVAHQFQQATDFHRQSPTGF